MTERRCLQPPEGAAAAAAVRYRAALPVVETERLRLRPPVLEDCALWTQVWMAYDDELTPEHAWEEFCVYIAGWLLHGHGLWSVERRADGALIGFVLLGLEWEDFEPELGWAFASEARGQGYATEAARGARDYAEGLFAPGQIVTYVDVANTRSRRLAERLGATLEGPVPSEPDTLIYRHGSSEAAP